MALIRELEREFLFEQAAMTIWERIKFLWNAGRVECPYCGQQVTPRGDGKLLVHTAPSGTQYVHPVEIIMSEDWSRFEGVVVNTPGPIAISPAAPPPEGMIEK